MKNEARIFLTDYASYNNGSQFEFGHWVDLDDFTDADDLREYIQSHFSECDKKSPLAYGAIREETMFTDFEGFPEEFYRECMDLDLLFEYFEKVEACPYDEEVIQAFIDLGNYDLDHLDSFFYDLEETYQGEYSNDEDFVQQLFEDDESLSNLPNYIYIDWEKTASHEMQGYHESDGHYFRVI